MVALRLWLPLPLIGEMAIHTCAVVDGPAVDGRPDAVVVVAEVLARRLDAEVEAPMTDRLTLDPAVAMTTHQLPVVGRRLIRTRVLCMYHSHIIISLHCVAVVQPHLVGVSALPCKTGNTKIIRVLCVQRPHHLATLRLQFPT